jgi:Holliday junction resolvasome RuvABC endonuclease subunit
MKPCTAKSCGIMPLVKSRILKCLNEWEQTNRTFVGIDVSSTCTGVTAIRARGSKIKCICSVALDMKRKAADDKTSILHRRFDILKNALQILRDKFPEAENRWNVAVEDKIVRAGGSKGVIGSHTLAEVIVAARIAAYQVFPEHIPMKINPRSARAGLGLNIVGEGAGREETKANVLEFVKTHAINFEVTDKVTDQDRADAFIVALSALRSALNVEISVDNEIRKHFRNCHAPVSTNTKENVRLSKELELNFNDRIQGWSDDVWLLHQFPQREKAQDINQ